LKTPQIAAGSQKSTYPSSTCPSIEVLGDRKRMHWR
jgi:hypothetical protein